MNNITVLLDQGIYLYKGTNSYFMLRSLSDSIQRAFVSVRDRCFKRSSTHFDNADVEELFGNHRIRHE